MTANDDAPRDSALPWWHQASEPQRGADRAGDESLTSATDELVRLLASLGDWVKVGGGTRARTTWDSASRVLGGSVRPEVVEHLQAAALELAAAVQAAMVQPQVGDSESSGDGVRSADDETADDEAAEGDSRGGAESSAAAKVQRINLD